MKDLNYWQNYGQNTVIINQQPSVTPALNLPNAEKSFYDISNLIYVIRQQGKIIDHFSVDFSAAVSTYVKAHPLIDGGFGSGDNNLGSLGEDASSTVTWMPGSSFDPAINTNLQLAFSRSFGNSATLGDGGTIWSIPDPFPPAYYPAPTINPYSSAHPTPTRT